MTNLYRLINYSGILAFSFLVAGLLAVVFGLDIRLHKLAGILVFIFACIHLGLILYKSAKLKKARAQK